MSHQFAYDNGSRPNRTPQALAGALRALLADRTSDLVRWTVVPQQDDELCFLVNAHICIDQAEWSGDTYVPVDDIFQGEIVVRTILNGLSRFIAKALIEGLPDPSLSFDMDNLGEN
jgi:hypothetical protein